MLIKNGHEKEILACVSRGGAFNNLLGMVDTVEDGLGNKPLNTVSSAGSIGMNPDEKKEVRIGTSSSKASVSASAAGNTPGLPESVEE
jgi:hypothetical protein